MTTTAARPTTVGPPPPPAPGRTVVVGGRAWRVQGPSWRDQRMHVAAVIFSLHAIGQLWLDFELSLAQILICLGTGAAIDLAVVLVRDHALVWPGSALLTSNGVAFIFRVNGTEPGDWWSTRGGWMFAACAAISVLSKYALRVGDRHLFNPSNLGLVVCFLAFGTGRVNPLDFWWGPWSVPMALVYVVILVGGTTLSLRVGTLPLAATFWVTFAAALGVVALSGHAISARWHVGPLTDGAFWWAVVASPEILVFLFFMITDPRTVPRGSVARLAYAVTVGLSSAGLAATQRTEFGTKVAVLAGLLVGCALRPAFERWLPAPAPGTAADGLRAWWASVLGTGPTVGRRRLVAAAAPVVAVVALLALSSPARRPLASAGLVVDEAVVAGRPDVEVGDPIPVVVDDSATHLAGGTSPEEAEALVRDLREDLEIERRAIVAGDADLAATASAGLRLDEVRARFGTTPPAVAVPRAATVIAVRDPGNPQAVPRLGVVLDHRDGLRSLYVLTLVGDDHLIVEERDPPS